MSDGDYERQHGRILRELVKMAKKVTRHKQSDASKKTVKGENYSSDSLKSVWCFDRIDRVGKFAFNIDRDDFSHKDFLEKLLNYGSMTWSEIKKQTHDDGKSKHHFLPTYELSKEAIDRFKIKGFPEEADSIFSFALENKLRIIGIRKNEFFHVMWYDPEHEFCPSKKKRT